MKQHGIVQCFGSGLHGLQRFMSEFRIGNLGYSDWEERIGRPTLVKDYSEPAYIVEDVATPTKLGGNSSICCKDNIEVEQF